MASASASPCLPAAASALSRAAFEDPLVQSVAAYVKEYMGRYDASHDVHHIRRVVGLAHHLYEKRVGGGAGGSGSDSARRPHHQRRTWTCAP